MLSNSCNFGEPEQAVERPLNSHPVMFQIIFATRKAHRNGLNNDDKNVCSIHLPIMKYHSIHILIISGFVLAPHFVSFFVSLSSSLQY